MSDQRLASWGNRWFTCSVGVVGVLLLASLHRLMRWQLCLWFVGMMILTLPWHFVGLLGMPRRMSYYDYSHPDIQPQAWGVVASVIGGAILVVSAFLFIWILARAHLAPKATPAPYRFATAVHEPQHVPVALNGFTLWIALMVGLTVTNYGVPIYQLVTNPMSSVPAVPVGIAR